MEDDEADFWTAMEYRVCAELAGLGKGRAHSNWCDGLVPDEYDLGSEPPCVRGRAYCGRSGQEVWHFTLLISNGLSPSGEVDWVSLLPADDMTGWLSPYPLERRLVLDPGSAYPSCLPQ